MEMLKKHGLPSKKELALELDLSDLDAKKNLLRQIYGKINDRLDFFTSLLENLLQPNGGLGDMHEYNAFSDEERIKILSLYKELMFISRKALNLEIDVSDAACASFIKEFWNSWFDMKKELKFIVSRMEGSWRLDSKIKVELGYLG